MSAQNLLRVSFFSALSFAATSLLPAQTVTLRGELHDSLIGGCYYCPTSHWVIKNSETPVTSSVVNLALFVNKQLALTGTWNATSKPPALNVTSVIEVLESMSATGSASLGGRLRFTTDGAPNDVTAQAIALKPGFFPILGTAMTLDYATLLVIGAGTLDGSGEFKTEVPIPNSASLVGLHLLSEALIVPANNSAIYSTNPRLSVVVP